MFSFELKYPEVHGEFRSGEISNVPFNEYGTALMDYYGTSRGNRDYEKFVKSYGSIKFGEIRNLLLSDYEKSFINFLS